MAAVKLGVRAGFAGLQADAAITVIEFLTHHSRFHFRMEAATFSYRHHAISIHKLLTEFLDCIRSPQRQWGAQPRTTHKNAPNRQVCQ